MQSRYWLWAGCLLMACSGGRPPPEPPPALDSEQGDALVLAGIALPALPLDVERSDLQDGWGPVERALTLPAPSPPVGEAWEVDAWADDVLADWISRRAGLLAEAQRGLAMAREDDPEVSVVASTMLGLVYSRFALDLRGIPTPAAFSANEARATGFRDALDALARPLWQRALDAYGSCSATAAEAPAHTLSRWREYCDAELRMLSPMLDATPDEPGDAP